MSQSKPQAKQSENKQIVTKDMNLADILFKWPDTAEIFLDYGLHCVGCIAAGFDTIEMGAKVHNMTDEEIEEMVTRVNEVALHSE